MTQKSQPNQLKDKPASIFDHLANITYKKVPWEDLSEVDRKSFSPYMINRWLSMEVQLVELVNEFQQYTIGQLEPQDVYKLYYSFLPKQKFFNKYIKSTKKENKELMQYLMDYFEAGPREVRDYLELLREEQLERILSSFGLKEKEISKLLKDVNNR